MADHICLECVGRADVEEDTDEVIQLKKKFKDFENVSGRNWGQVNLAAKQFKSLILQTSLIGVHPEKVFAASSMADVLTSFLASGIVNEAYISEIFCTVYHCVRLSKNYHLALYNERRFWCILFERILSFPDVQFFEAVMAFVMVVCQIFTEKTKGLCCGRYLVTVESYQYITGHFHPEKFYPIFKKLLEIQEKNITSNDTAFTIDYRNCVSPLFAPSVARAEWYALKKNSPVEFMSLLIHLFLTRPIMLEHLFIQAPGVSVLMSVFRNQSCKHMHASLMFCLDAMLSIDNDCKYNLFLELMKKLDFPLILNIAVYDDLHYLRALAQKVILHTLTFIETERKNGIFLNRPRKRDLLEVDYTRLKDMISVGGMDDKVFAFILVKERVDIDRENILKENFQDFAACILLTCEEKLAHCKQDLRLQLITVALTFLVNIGPLEEREHPNLMRIYTIDCMFKFFKNEDKDIRLLSRACVFNLCHLNFDKRIELLKLYPIKTLVDDMYDVYEKNRKESFEDEQYFQLLPINLKLIHSLLTVQYRMKTTGACDKKSGQRDTLMDLLLKPSKSGLVCITGDHFKKMLEEAKTADIDESAIVMKGNTVNKLMEILVSAIFETRVSELLHVVSLSCMAHLMHGGLDVSKFLTEKVVTTGLGLYKKEFSNSHYLTEGGDFKTIYEKTCLSRLKITDEKQVKDKPTSKSQEKSSQKPCDKNSTKNRDSKSINPKSQKKSAQRILESSRDQKPEESEAKKSNLKVSDEEWSEYSDPEFSGGKASVKDPDRKLVVETSVKKPLPKLCSFPLCPNRECDNENGKIKKMKKCGKCRSIVYCGRDCQVQHWNDHKKSCKPKL